jgi:hypothetical protein
MQCMYTWLTNYRNFEDSLEIFNNFKKLQNYVCMYMVLYMYVHTRDLFTLIWHNWVTITI